jgi:hypothetical protein
LPIETSRVRPIGYLGRNPEHKSGKTADRKYRFFRSQLSNRNMQRLATTLNLFSAALFRATGITAYMKNGGKLETAQHIANHESPRTTKLYDRRQDEISLDEVERIAI